jgi:hypothetical protein
MSLATGVCPANALASGIAPVATQEPRRLASLAAPLLASRQHSQGGRPRRQNGLPDCSSLEPVGPAQCCSFYEQVNAFSSSGVFPMLCIGKMERFQPVRRLATDRNKTIQWHPGTRPPISPRTCPENRMQTALGEANRPRGSSKKHAEGFSAPVEFQMRFSHRAANCPDCSQT